MVGYLLEGSQHSIYYIREGTDTFRDWAGDIGATGPTAAEVLDDPSLEDRSPSPPEWEKVLAALEKIADEGYEKLAKINMVNTWPGDDGKEVAEVKKGGVRIPFFEDETSLDQEVTRLILTHGFQRENEEGQFDHFRALRMEYYEWELRTEQ
jgi:hypothetical protein